MTPYPPPKIVSPLPAVAIFGTFVMLLTTNSKIRYPFLHHMNLDIFFRIFLLFQKSLGLKMIYRIVLEMENNENENENLM